MQASAKLMMNEQVLFQRMRVNPKISGGKPIIRGRRRAVDHALGMVVAGDTLETSLQRYPYLEPTDIQACPAYAPRLVGHEQIEPLPVESPS